MLTSVDFLLHPSPHSLPLQFGTHRCRADTPVHLDEVVYCDHIYDAESQRREPPPPESNFIGSLLAIVTVVKSSSNQSAVFGHKLIYADRRRRQWSLFPGTGSVRYLYYTVEAIELISHDWHIFPKKNTNGIL
jgi:hypothetical protein